MMHLFTKKEPKKKERKHYLIPTAKKLYRLIDKYNKLIDNKEMKGQEALAKKIIELLNSFEEYSQKTRGQTIENERIRGNKD